MRRRTVLRTAAAGLGVGLAGCNRDRTDDHSASSYPVANTDRYDTIVDLVGVGADPSGETSILPVLEEHVDDDTLLVFQDGRFRMDGTLSVSGLSNVGFAGVRSTIVPEPGSTDVLFFVEADEGLRFEGIDFDMTDATTGGRPLQLRANDDLEISNVTLSGTLDRGPTPCRFDVLEAGGTGVVENLSLPDGATAGTGITGVYVGNRSYGDITFRDCEIVGFPDNGLYADPPGGSMHVEGGFYANNGISNVRVKGGSTVEDVHVRVDEDHRQFSNMRGIRATDYRPQTGTEPVVVEDCKVEIFDVTHSDGAIELSSQLAELVVRDTAIRVDADGVDGVRAKRPSSEVDGGDQQPTLRCENVSITGTAVGGSAVRVSDRHGCVMEDLFVHQMGADRDGIEFRRSRENVVNNCVIDVRGESVKLIDSTADIQRTISTHGIDESSV